MRTTYTPDPDVEAAIEALRRKQGIGPSEAINQLVRRGLAASPAPKPFKQRTFDMAARVDVGNIGEVLDMLDD